MIDAAHGASTRHAAYSGSGNTLTSLRRMARSRRVAKSSDVRTAVADSFGLSKGAASIAARIRMKVAALHHDTPLEEAQVQLCLLAQASLRRSRPHSDQ